MTVFETVIEILTEAPRSYISFGHGEGSDAWVWDAGRLRFASEEGIDADQFHRDIYADQGALDFAGRYDPVKRQASITAWDAMGHPMVDKRAKVVARRLSDRLPDVEAIWYFSGQRQDQPGQRIA